MGAGVFLSAISALKVRARKIPKKVKDANVTESLKIYEWEMYSNIHFHLYIALKTISCISRKNKCSNDSTQSSKISENSINHHWNTSCLSNVSYQILLKNNSHLTKLLIKRLSKMLFSYKKRCWSASRKLAISSRMF